VCTDGTHVAKQRCSVALAAELSGRERLLSMSSPEVEIFLPRFIKSNGPHLHLQSEIFTVPIVTTMVTTILLISPSSNGNDSLPPQQQQQQPER